MSHDELARHADSGVMAFVVTHRSEVHNVLRHKEVELIGLNDIGSEQYILPDNAKETTLDRKIYFTYSYPRTESVRTMCPLVLETWKREAMLPSTIYFTFLILKIFITSISDAFRPPPLFNPGK